MSEGSRLRVRSRERALAWLVFAVIALVGACSDDPAAVMPPAGATAAPPAATGPMTTPIAMPPSRMPAMATGGAAAPMALPMAPVTGGGMAMAPTVPVMSPEPGMPMAGASNTDMQTIVPDPSWDCAMPEGIPPPEMGELVFEVELELGEVYDMGTTQYGERLLTEIKGGAMTGMLTGQFMGRGLDWQLTLPNGSIELEQVNIFTANGGTVYFRNCGVSAAGGEKVRIVPDFEAPNGGALAFLNEGKFAGYREFDKAGKTMKMSVYDITDVTAPADKVTIVDPPELRNQTWECKPRAGTQGGVLYQESVGIMAGAIMVGASKRGTRNIIPITGGTTTAGIEGGVLDGGADFQLLGGGFILDARYTLKTNDDELIIVRNCGAASGLIPVFETRTDGPYAYVNDGNYFSSTPSPTGCCVAITIYKE